MTYQKFSTSYYWIVSIIIIIYNAIFYIIIHPFVKYIGYHSKTDEIRLTSFTIFCCLMTDMIIIPTFIGMNLMEHSDSKISTIIFKGRYTDFNYEWYPDVGIQVIITLIIFSFQPLIDFTVEYLLWRANQWYNRERIYNPKNDRDTYLMNVRNDYLRYIDLYAGPEYAFQYHSANTCLICFSAIIYGPIMPLLYFVALFAIGMQYFMERVTLTYFYRLPPKFSEKLTIANTRIIQFAPLVSLPFVLWVYTNRQMFGNDIQAISTDKEITLSHHLISDFFKKGYLKKSH